MNINIKRLRESAKMTQVQLAAAIGCRPEEISRWERGRNGPGPMARKVIAQLKKQGVLR